MVGIEYSSFTRLMNPSFSEIVRSESRATGIQHKHRLLRSSQRSYSEQCCQHCCSDERIVTYFDLNQGLLKNLGFGRPDIPKRHGSAISKAQLEHLLELEPRRHRLKDPSWHNLSWSALREPYDQSTDWSVNFPFFETYGPAFDEYCRSVADSAPIDRTPFERNDGSRVKYTFLKNTSQEQLDDIGAWIDLVGQYV